MSAVQGAFLPYESVYDLDQDAKWSQTDPKATLIMAPDGGSADLTLPAGMVPDCAGMYDIMGPAYLFAASLAPVHVQMDAEVEVALHIEFEIPDIGRPVEVALALSSRAAEFLPGYTSSLNINPQISAATGSNAASFSATSLFTVGGAHGVQNVTAGNHVWDISIPMRMEKYQIGATFDLIFYCFWDVPTPLQALATQKIVTTRMTATITRGAVEPPPPPSILHYRDPADGKFKPLSNIKVRGFPCEDVPVDHVYKIEEPTGSGRARFWISASEKYGADRIGSPLTFPVGGTPVEIADAYPSRRGTATVSNGKLVLYSPPAATPAAWQNMGSRWSTTWQHPGVGTTIPMNPGEVLRANIKARVRLVGFHNDAATAVKQPGGSAVSLKVAGGSSLSLGSATWTADGVVLTSGSIEHISSGVNVLLNGGELTVELTSYVVCSGMSSANMPAMTVTLEELEVFFTVITPSLPKLYELVDDAYQRVDYPPA